MISPVFPPADDFSKRSFTWSLTTGPVAWCRGSGGFYAEFTLKGSKLLQEISGDALPNSRWVSTQIFFMFTPNLGEDEPNLTNIFEMG